MDLILDQLQNTFQANETVRFLNVYHGVPVSYTGQVLEVKNKLARFRTHTNQIFCIQAEKMTYIESNFLPRPVGAKMINSDIVEERICLGNFEYAKGDIGLRTAVRVEPKDPLEANVTGAQSQGPRVLVSEISINGVAILIRPNQYQYMPLLFSKGRKIDLDFRLPNLDPNIANIHLAGIVRNVFTQTGKSFVRVGLQTFPEKDTEPIISKFIASRQTDILKELRNACQTEVDRLKLKGPAPVGA